jgi:predicted nucleotidyltransferase
MVDQLLGPSLLGALGPPGRASTESPMSPCRNTPSIVHRSPPATTHPATAPIEKDRAFIGTHRAAYEPKISLALKVLAPNAYISAMTTRALMDELKIYLDERNEPDMIAAYLFGSAARGEARPQSDVDIAVLLAGTPPKTLDHPSIRLAGELEHRLGSPVQVVVLNEAPVDLIHRVLRDGQLIIDRDRSRRIRFEVRARNEYFDLLPFLRRYRRQAAAV